MKKEKLLSRKRKSMEIAGERGVYWTGQVKYRNEVATSASSAGGKRIYGAYGGGIIAFKHDDKIFIFHVMCEWTYFENNMSDAFEIINSFQLVSSETEIEG